MEHPHWYYFSALVDDFEALTRYVEISTENYSTYSLEFVRLLLACGSEIDVVAKLICAAIEPAAQANGIRDYQRVITAHYPNLPTIEIDLPRYDISVVPWKSWRTDTSPDWWKKYNDVKHERNKHFSQANLENTLSALGGLCVLVSYLYHKELSDRTILNVPRFLFLGTQYRSKGVLMFKSCWELPEFRGPDEKLSIQQSTAQRPPQDSASPSP